MLAIGAALLTACTGTPGAPPPGEALDPATTTVEYRFLDASVEASYQRSFVVTAVADSASVVVTSGSVEVGRDEQPLADGVIAELVTAYNDGDLADVFSADPSAPCTGASSQGLTLDDGEHRADITFTYCGENNDSARTRLREVVAPLLDPFDIETLTDGRFAG